MSSLPLRYSKGSNPSKDNVSVSNYVEECLENSLKLLLIDCIDLHILHCWDYQNSIEKYLESFHKYIQEIIIVLQFVSVQSHCNLIMREDEPEILSFCADENIAMMPYSSLAFGCLSHHPDEHVSIS